MRSLLEINDLTLCFNGISVVRHVSLALNKGKVLALVGESGSGKSMTAFSIMRLVPQPGKITEGAILLDGQDLLALSEEEMRRRRGKDIAMIFQEPMTSLNPVLTIARQLTEAMEAHEKISRKDALDRAVLLLERVGIPAPRERLHDYPHQFSGGMRQRVMIAMALASSPKILLADEPTTALDITIQRQILQLLQSLAHEGDMGILLITHDLGVVAECADDVAVMYAGEIVETCPAEEFFRNPLHPYAQKLMECAPLLGNHEQSRLPFIQGSVPQPGHLPTGCAFRPRCHLACSGCDGMQALEFISESHAVRCHLRTK